MSATEYRDFWSVTVPEVPAKTGAAGLMDCADIRDVLEQIDLDLSHKTVLDVGCGTGRVSQLCGAWSGVDVSPSMVAYCLEHGLQARVIVTPLDLVGLFEHPWGEKPFDAIVCLSVFTHIAQTDRQSYLHTFRSLAPELLVDILPGADGGGIAAWYAEPAEFELDLHDAGFDDIVDCYERTSADGHRHLYYRCR